MLCMMRAEKLLQWNDERCCMLFCPNSSSAGSSADPTGAVGWLCEFSGTVNRRSTSFRRSRRDVLEGRASVVVL